VSKLNRTRSLVAGAVAAALVFCSHSVAAADVVLTSEDYIAIQRLYAAYARTIDSAGVDDGSAYAETYTLDGEFSGTVGREALKKLIRTFYETQRHEGWASRHTYFNIVITPTSEGAVGSAYAVIYKLTAEGATIWRVGVYDDVLAKTSDGWRFKKRVFDTTSAPKLVSLAPGS
jgi:hypothetical protein